MITPEQRKLINKLREGQCSEKELEVLFQMVKTLPTEEADQVMDELWKQARPYPKLSAELSEKMYANVLSRIDTGGIRTASKKVKMHPLRYRRNPSMLVAGAAAVLLLLGAVFTWLWLDNTQENIIMTAAAEQKTVALPDGSVVTINPNSSLRFKNQWNKKEDRVVWLQGEAFFEVAKKPETKQKFQVVTPDLTVEVLGTIFHINSQTGQTSVYLKEGKIAFSLKEQPEQVKTMAPGERLTFSAKDKKIRLDHSQTASLPTTSWKDGTLIFDKTPLDDILREIEAIYSIEFQVQDTMNYQRRFDGGLPMRELEIAIPILEHVLQLEIDKEKDLFIIR